ncbi:MAG: uL15 family ribosomal protein [Candidatus Diapherotrites archaeon]|nr:uL15 family ribosomal protein [Candidatus Diapherotrites archaeon]
MNTEKKPAVLKELNRRAKRPNRLRTEVNLWRLQQIAEKNPQKILAVPGKVLSEGNLTAPLTVIAQKYSQHAAEKITKAKGRALLWAELPKQKPSQILIIG